MWIIDVRVLATISGGAAAQDTPPPPGRNRESLDGEISVDTPWFNIYKKKGRVFHARTDYAKCLEAQPLSASPEEVRAACRLPNGQP